MKKGDRVKNKLTGAIDTIKSMPGDADYDAYNFSNSLMRMLLTKNSWDWQNLWELVDHKFKVGDRIKNVRRGGHNEGKLATVIGHHSISGATFYKYDDGSYGACELDEEYVIEKVEQHLDGKRLKVEIDGKTYTATLSKVVPF